MRAQAVCDRRLYSRLLYSSLLAYHPSHRALHLCMGARRCGTCAVRPQLFRRCPAQRRTSRRPSYLFKMLTRFFGQGRATKGFLILSLFFFLFCIPIERIVSREPSLVRPASPQIPNRQRVNRCAVSSPERRYLSARTTTATRQLLMGSGTGDAMVRISSSLDATLLAGCWQNRVMRSWSFWEPMLCGLDVSYERISLVRKRPTS